MMTDDEIRKIAGDPTTCPCNPWWLKEHVVCGDVQKAVIAFARAIESRCAAPSGAERDGDELTIAYMSDVADGKRAAPPASTREQIRNEALEEATKAVEARFMGDMNREDMEVRKCVSAIRALKSEAHGQGERE